MEFASFPREFFCLINFISKTKGEESIGKGMRDNIMLWHLNPFVQISKHQGLGSAFLKWQDSCMGADCPM